MRGSALWQHAGQGFREGLLALFAVETPFSNDELYGLSAHGLVLWPVDAKGGLHRDRFVRGKQAALMVPSPMANPGNCKSVLVVEDDDAIRITLVDLLESEGYKVFAANNGRDALQVLEAHVLHPCLILLDLFMPVMSGQDFMKEIKRNNTHVLASIPIVLVSAAGEGATEAKKQATGFIKKPIDLEYLLSVVKLHCG